LKLSIALSQPIEYIESMSIHVYNEYKALNLISPFVYDAQSHRDGLMIAEMRNSTATEKKHLKTPSDFLPYLGSDTNKYLEDDIVYKCRTALNSCTGGGIVNKYLYDDVMEAIQIELDEAIELKDQYRAAELTKMIKGQQKNGN
jgi:hypothetical protein